MKAAAVVVAAFFLAVCAACGNGDGGNGDVPDGEACVNNGDCQSGMCVSKVCRAICNSAADCTGNLGCRNGVCRDCWDAMDCGGYYNCDRQNGVCKDRCDSDEDCALGGYCDEDNDHACHESRENGDECYKGRHCQSGRCVDGVCCESICLESCHSCAVPGSEGQCTVVVGVYDPDSCESNEVCSPSGACKLGVGQGCDSDTDCAGGICADGACCEELCSGECRSCAVPGYEGHCRDIRGQQDPEYCTEYEVCGVFGTCQLINGEDCGSSLECASGECAEHLCCDQPCDGQCRSCDVPGHVGTCTVLTYEADPQYCSANEICNGQGYCDSTLGDACTGAEQCATGFCVNHRCCNEACGALGDFCDVWGVCQHSNCGDGFTDATEVCDDRNNDDCAGDCRGDCQAWTGCGDNVVCPGEECDDGGTEPNDGCSPTCRIDDGYLKVPPTGQTRCYNTAGAVVDCSTLVGGGTPAPCGSSPLPLCGQDAQYRGGLARGLSCANIDGAIDCAEPLASGQLVLDAITGLTWQRQSVTSKTWFEGKLYCDNLTYATYTDWRLPEAFELFGLIDGSTMNPAIDRQSFPSTTSGPYWTATASPDTGMVWSVDMNQASLIKRNKSDLSTLRCVRGVLVWPTSASRYEMDGAMVRDRATGLMWQWEYVNRTWGQGLQYCENLELGGYSNWRLPDIKELATLFDFTRPGPCSLFPDMPGLLFLSSTPYYPSAGQIAVFGVQFGASGSGISTATGAGVLRCVRSGP